MIGLKLHPGDILEANADAQMPLRFLLIVDNPRKRTGWRVYPNGIVSQEKVEPSVDRLVACGRDEDCRGHLDLAMACAAERIAHQVSARQDVER